MVKKVRSREASQGRPAVAIWFGQMACPKSHLAAARPRSASPACIQWILAGAVRRVSENNGALAQLGEHLLCKQGVIGSIPISSTIFKSLTHERPFGPMLRGGAERSAARARARWVPYGWFVKRRMVKRFQAVRLGKADWPSPILFGQIAYPKSLTTF